MANKKINCLDDKMLVEVLNNDTGSVSYYSELNRVKRKWERPNTVKKISLEELKELANTYGGFKLLENSVLLIKDNAVRQELSLSVDPEYTMGEEEINELLKKSTEEIVETMDKAPEVINEKIAMKAIETENNDLNKLEVIKEKSGIDVLTAIQDRKEDKKEKNKKK